MNSWTDLNFFQSTKFKQILTFLNKERETKIILPDKDNIFKAFELTALEDVKVVILGQDPYPTPGHAMGLAFSVPNGTNPLPPSLKNIFKEINEEYDLHHTHYHNPDLTRWAQQGVLLLNTSLTVVAGMPNSHQDIGWSVLITDVLQAINEYKTNVVFILWGNNARKKAMFIDQNKHLILQSAHPSPLSAHQGFFGSQCFSDTNKYLQEHNKEPIRW